MASRLGALSLSLSKVSQGMVRSVLSSWAPEAVDFFFFFLGVSRQRTDVVTAGSWRVATATAG
jgi:hypothetical protein